MARRCCSHARISVCEATSPPMRPAFFLWPRRCGTCRACASCAIQRAAGSSTVMHDIARITGSTVHLDETAIPVHPPVRAVCNILGYDPLYLACEGRIVAVLSAEALDAWRAMPSGDEAAIIGGLNGTVHRSYCTPK